MLNVVGLTEDLLRYAPRLQSLANAGGIRSLKTIVPAVTTSVQSTMLTGTLPSEHGIVGNGWYFRELAEILFWRQSNHLVQGEMVWDAARKLDPLFTCAQLFWWYNMYSSAGVSVTPRPMYPADGRKLPDIYTEPASLRDELQSHLGRFPLFNFWGPTANIISSRWIADSTLHILARYHPTLTLVYLPHLDYNLQRLGPSAPEISKDVAEIDNICGELIDQALKSDSEVVVLSEYGITDVNRPIHINRVLREAGFLHVREELGRELLDAGASRAFAVADHQVAHVYVAHTQDIAPVAELLRGLDGVETVLDEAGKRLCGLDHPRSGELVAISDAHSWFTYYYFLDDRRAPDFARTVDIHRKPGYDPVELFLDPTLTFPKLKIASKLLRKTIGMRYLMDVIPLDANLVKGSHGRPTDRDSDGPVFITSAPQHLPDGPIAAANVKSLLLRHLFGTDKFDLLKT